MSTPASLSAQPASKTGQLIHVTPAELDAVLHHMQQEQSTQLFILGPRCGLADDPNDWPELLRGGVVYELGEDVPDLPLRIARLPQLSSLMLCGAEISDAGIRDIIARHTNLTSLDVSSNNIGESGARAIAERLNKLTSLYVSGNNIGEGGARVIAERLTNLTSVGVGENNIGEGGVRAIAERLANLTSLYVWNNNIGDGGARAIAERLTNLTSLNLSNNPVKDLSPFAAWIKAGWPVRAGYPSGDVLNVRDCPLETPPLEIVRQGPEAVRNYFIERERQSVVRLYEAKVLIVGEGGSGKTTLLRRLYRPDLPMPEEKDTTRGIDIHRQDFDGNHQGAFRLNVWDFGGQQIYHATHQFFLTKSSLYVLVDDTRKDDKSIHDESFKFWFEVIESLTEKSPILIFQNEKGGRSKSLDLPSIKGRFPNVIEVYAGNLEHPQAAEALKQAIQFRVQQLPHVGTEVPAKWADIRREIEELSESRQYISQDEYFAIYARHLGPSSDDAARVARPEYSKGVASESQASDSQTRPSSTQGRATQLAAGLSAEERTKALFLSRYLHDLGVFLHFQDDMLLKKTVILQNHWATDAVFRVLDDETTKKKLGRFTLADCSRLWHEPEYADMHAELIGLMKKFELCYQLPDTQPETWLAPQLLPPSKPAQFAGSDSIVGGDPINRVSTSRQQFAGTRLGMESQATGWAQPSDLVVRFKYPFLPRGLVSRLMVRQHRFARQLDWSWRHGAFFEHNGTAVLVEETLRGNEIEFRARGPERKELLSVLAGDLEALNHSFEGLRDRVDKLVPCICKICSMTTDPEMYRHKELIERRSRGKRTIECRREPYKDVEVLKLLDGIEPGHMPAWASEPTEPSTPSEKRFRIALSFAGENREFVEQVAEHLSKVVGRERVLYDEYYEAEFSRINLDTYLPKLYREEAELVVVFLCADYRQKRWCKLEWRHIKNLIATADEDRIMLTRFEDPGDLSDIGILSGDGYADVGSREPAAIAELILQRLNGTP